MESSGRKEGEKEGRGRERKGREVNECLLFEDCRILACTFALIPDYNVTELLPYTTLLRCATTYYPLWNVLMEASCTQIFKTTLVAAGIL